MTLFSRRYFFFACIIVALCTTAAAYPTAKFNSEQVFPAASWQKVKSLRAAGWSEDKLDIARRYAESIHSSAVMVIQGSEVIAEWGNVEQKINSYTMRKSLISGIYQAGAETFLVERLYEYLMSFVEVQSGIRYSSRMPFSFCPSSWYCHARIPVTRTGSVEIAATSRL